VIRSLGHQHDRCESADRRRKGNRVPQRASGATRCEHQQDERRTAGEPAVRPSTCVRGHDERHREREGHPSTVDPFGDGRRIRQKTAKQVTGGLVADEVEKDEPDDAGAGNRSGHTRAADRQLCRERRAE
jgi:hypothetical protein